ncbi:NAD(P)H-dependent flavin oxidoreductase YrpB (nitropropane dioxygenase family) [Tamaricihabitans halophyticus]|uniref:NAD(P)H-dependent flavin oxidoreductase YrpB (Nitropropane dioxygenase family) n=1 Tax=Tamaricihabitans halophyticus TaxID=1262583 RepID=A0A4R2R3Z5_9PSEU|nr:nitronate monooxygenase [Tamaricihabitans halophyticus]TCP54261.1 NAD(P)H-dependent flavin oxidoreductase YrpB (nitropropane dioxygenase family) [Tamaricihabitans halophyticus]
MSQYPDSPLCSRLGASVPIFGFSHSLDVVVAISRAGGIGVWGATRNTPAEIESGLARLATETAGAPFAVDLVLPKDMPARQDRSAIEEAIPTEHRAFVDGLRRKYQVPDDGLPGVRSRFVRSEEMATDQLHAVLDSEVPLVAMGVGTPPAAVTAAKERGKRIISLVGAPKHAQRAIDAGADILVAQGYDAGAHTGEIGTFSLVPQIVELAGEIPVIAAGGVATGRHILAAFALGAQAVWMGTAWLFTTEHQIDPIIAAKLVRAGSGDTVRSRADSGKTLRQIKSAWTEEWSAAAAPTPLGMPYQDILVGDLLGSVERNRIEPLMKSEAGQSVGYFSGQTTVPELMADLATQTSTATGALRNRLGHND